MKTWYTVDEKVNYFKPELNKMVDHFISQGYKDVRIGWNQTSMGVMTQGKRGCSDYFPFLTFTSAEEIMNQNNYPGETYNWLNEKINSRR